MKKIILTGVFCFTAIICFVKINPTIQISNGAVSLRSIMIMANALDEGGAGGYYGNNCYMRITYTGASGTVQRCGDNCSINYCGWTGEGKCN